MEIIPKDITFPILIIGWILGNLTSFRAGTATPLFHVGFSRQKTSCSFSSEVKKDSRLSQCFGLSPVASACLNPQRAGSQLSLAFSKHMNKTCSSLVPNSHLFVWEKMAFDWLTWQVPQEPRQFCISTDCCHYQSLLSRVIKFKIKGILHVCVIPHKAYLLIDQLLYCTSPTLSHCTEKPRVQMGMQWGRPWLPAGNIVSPSASICGY